MKELKLEQLESIQGGVDIGETITGVCAAIGVAAAIKLIVLSPAAAGVVGVGCAINGAGNYFDWW